MATARINITFAVCGALWIGGLGWKNHQTVTVGEGPFQESGTLREVLLRKVTNDGDFQNGQLVDGYVTVQRRFKGGIRERSFDLSMFKSAEDLWAPEETREKVMDGIFDC